MYGYENILKSTAIGIKTLAVDFKRPQKMRALWGELVFQPDNYYYSPPAADCLSSTLS